MTRIKRILPNEPAALHIICRGNNRQDIFHKDADKKQYYEILNSLRDENKICIFHYCLMTNHIHLITYLKKEAQLSKFMKQVNLKYYYYYQKNYDYSGHLFQERFKSNIIEIDSYLLQCGKYIELNPVRAGMVNNPGSYRFSSYNFYAKGEKDKLVTESPTYIALAQSQLTRRDQYSDFILEKTINSELFKKKLYIGTPEFVSRLEQHFKVKNLNEREGRPSKTGTVLVFSRN